jgi:hypothetical protein
MGGGLMQLVAYGAQDIYLTGNPQITFFKVVYRRHTNFAMECIQQTLNGATAIAAAAGSSTATISRNGDLVSKLYVRCDQGTTTATAISGDNLITDVELEIGGQRIDKHTQEWLKMWVELTTPESKTAGYKYMSGGYSNILGSCATVALGGTAQESLYVPLQFWFCRNPGLALPLIALQYHEVKVKFNWTAGASVSRDDSTVVTPTVELWADYIYLDTDERRRFAQVSHEYLIEQLQYQTESADNTSFKLNFNHPVKEMLWTADATSGTEWAAQKAKLQLNGHDRFAEQAREYFQIRQPYDHHTSVPGFNIKEIEKPRLLNPPVDTGVTSHHSGSTSGQTAVDIETTTITYAANSNIVTAGWQVGDIFSVELEAASAAAAPAGGLHMVTAIAAAVITIAPGLSDKPVDGDAMTITRVASCTRPQSRCSSLAKNISVYSFALKPEEHQPSGTCNFSRIDNAKLNFNTTCRVDTIYAVNYNVLRIMSGMGGLAYSN